MSDDSTLGGRRVLVTGGAGFIGRFLTDDLLALGADVRVLDNFDPQAHPEGPQPLPPEVEVRTADVRDADAVTSALEGVTDVVHLAAAVGIGQSMYEIDRYTDINVRGTAVLLQQMARDPARYRKLLVASSMSVYGEGLYHCDTCQAPREQSRHTRPLREGAFQPACATCGSLLRAVPTPESKSLDVTSVYALNKRDQEELSLMIGRAYGIPTVATRFFCTYGPGQSLRNPYTGVSAIFAARLLEGEAPLVFEDGNQTRDFIHVRDLSRACASVLARDVSDEVINLGTGVGHSIIDLAYLLHTLLGGPEPQVLNTYRAGDVRHCTADITRAGTTLDWEPRVEFRDGITELVAWQREQPREPGKVEQALGELRSRGLAG